MEASKEKAKKNNKKSVKKEEKPVAKDQITSKAATSTDLDNADMDTSHKASKVIKKSYSKEELQEFKELIEKKLESARKDLELLKEACIGTSNNDTADTSPTFKVMEEGQSVLSKEENSRLAVRQQKFIESLEMALVRIENGTYGVCRKTGNLISKERLRSVPHATLSIEAKMNERKNK